MQRVLFLVLFFSFCLLASEVQANYKILGHSSKASICDKIRTEGKDTSFPSTALRGTKKIKVYVPPTLASHLGHFTFGTEHVSKTAIRIGAPPEDYLASYEGYTHLRSDLPIISLDVLKKDPVVYMGTGAANIVRIPNLDQDYWIYINNFDATSNAATKINFRLDYNATMDWCEQGQEPVAPSKPVSSPSKSTWNISPQTISVSSTGADEIFYKIISTEKDDGEPETPSSPGTPGTSDSKVSNGKIVLSADPGVYKKFRISLRARNDVGWSEEAEYSYAIDRLPRPVGAVSVSPVTGTETGGTSLNVDVSSKNSTEIRYAITSSLSGEPDSPSETAVKSSTTKTQNGRIALTTRANEEKTVKIRFVGYNDNNPEEERFGSVSTVYTYTLKGDEIQPGPVAVSPASGTFTSRPTLNVTSPDSTRIFYVHTLDGSDPVFPSDMYMVSSESGPSAALQASGVNGQRRTFKIRFQGYNSNSNEYGPISQAYSYTIDLSSSGGGGGGGDPEPQPPMQGQAECEAAGGTWIDLFGLAGHCSMPSDPSAASFTRVQARSNPGEVVTGRTFSNSLGDYDPAKPFFKADDGEGNLSVEDLVGMFLNPHPYTRESDPDPYFEVSSDQGRLIFTLIDGNDDLGLGMVMKVLEIRTTSDDVDKLEVTRYGDLVFQTQNLRMNLRFAAGDWAKLNSVLGSNGFNTSETVRLGDADSRGVMRFNSYSPELGKPVDRVLRPSYTADTHVSCEPQVVDADGQDVFSVCYDSSGKWQRMVPFVYHYDSFYADLGEPYVWLDPFTGLMQIFLDDNEVWTFMPSSILEPGDDFSGETLRYDIIEDMTGNGIVELAIIKNGFRQILYTLSVTGEE